MSKRKTLAEAKPGDIVVIEEHNVVVYAGSEVKGACRYLVYAKEDTSAIIYRIRDKKSIRKQLYITIRKYSKNNDFGFLSWKSPYLVSGEVQAKFPSHKLPQDEFTKIEQLIKSDRAARRKLFAVKRKKYEGVGV